jgi:hypothetical protein
MNKSFVIAPSVFLLLLLAAAVCKAGQQPGRNLQLGGKPGTHAKHKPVKRRPDLCPEVIFVRDIYARLMRYQSAAVEMSASQGGTTPKPDDYITFEIRNLWSGAIDRIYDQDVDSVDAVAGGEIVKLTPHQISEPDGPAYAYYSAEWTGAQTTDDTGAVTLKAALLQNAGDPGRFQTFASYEVTVRLSGKERTYSAMALFTGEAEPLGRLKGQIFDNVTSGMNTVAADESPAAKAPWNEYFKSPRYRAVAAEIAQIKKSARPLIPAKAPFGHLPGDDIAEGPPDDCTSFDVAIFNDSPQGNDGCIAGTDPNGSTCSNSPVTVFVGQYINLGNTNNDTGGSPTYQWTVNGVTVDQMGYDAALIPQGGFALTAAETSMGGIAFYWIAPSAGQTVTVTLNVTDPNNPSSSGTATAKFIVVAPSATVVAKPGQMQITGSSPACQLQAGTGVAGSGGMTFTYQVSGNNGAPSAAANYNFGQVVQSTCGNTTWTPASAQCSTFATSGLDKGWPYGFNSAFSGGQTTDDSPKIPLGQASGAVASSASMNESFTMYLFYNPYPGAQTPGIWVPIVSVPWSVQGSTTRNSGNSGNSGTCASMYTAPSPSITPPTVNNNPINSASSLPQWTQIAPTNRTTVPCPVGGCLK